MVGFRVVSALLAVVLAAVLPSPTSAQLPWALTQLGPVVAAGASTPVFVRNETFAPVPAQNNAAPSAAATANLDRFTNFIVIINNQESHDALLGLYPNGNGLYSYPATDPLYRPQVSRGTYGGTAAGQSSTQVNKGQPLTSFPLDTAGQETGTIPNAPLLLNQFIPTTTAISSDPQHGYWQCIYKIDNGTMDGFVWSAGAEDGSLCMGHWNLTGSYLYQLASKYTMLDNFFESAFGGPLLAHLYLIGGRSVQWDNGNSQPPLVLDDNATLAYTNYSLVDGLQYDITQEGILTYPDNYLINNIHSPAFCGAPFFPVVNDATSAATLGKPANLGDQLIAANVPWVYYAESFNQEVQDAATGDNCKAVGTDAKLSSNMLPFTHYARFNPALPPYTSDWLTHFNDVNNGTGNFFAKLAAGTLEPVAWVQPDKRHDWGAGDVSPAASDAWLNSTLQAIFASPQYQANQTLVIITWSNANGIYDHVPPYAGDRFGPGLRVPTLLVSPLHAGGYVNSHPYEHLSIVKMLQRRFGLPMTGGPDGANPLLGAARDQSTRDLTSAMVTGPEPFVWTDPATPTVNAKTPSAQAASALAGYDHIVNIWLAGNSFDYIFGAYPGANGIANAVQGWHPQRSGTTLSQVPSCLSTLSPAEYYNFAQQPLPAGVPACWPNTQPFPVDSVVPLSVNGSGVQWAQDPSHKFYSDVYSIDGGKMDGFAALGGINAFTYSYYNTSLQGSYLWQLAQNYTLLDNFYKSFLGDSDLNFCYGVMAGQPIYWGNSPTACQNASGPYYKTTTFDPITGLVTSESAVVFNATDCHVIGESDPGLASYSASNAATWATKAPGTPFVTSPYFGQLLDAAGVSWAVYLQDFNAQYFANKTALQPGEPSLGADASTYSGHNNPLGYFQNFSIANINSSYRTAHMQDLDNLYTQLQANALPSVVWTSFSESYDMAISDSNVYDSSVYLQFLMGQLQNSSYWKAGKMLIAITWSDNGALYDHVPPYAGDRFGPGPRVPTLLISPSHAGGGINSQPYEHLSLMKMISTRFGLQGSVISPARTQSVRDLTNSFDDPSTTTTSGTTQTASLCILMYGLPGNVDYPWSSATSVQLVYSPSPVTTAQGTAVRVVSGAGTRVYTNRFGAQVVSQLTVAPAGTEYANNLLYLNASLPVDGGGLTWNLSSPVQQPGHGPTVLYSLINVYSQAGAVLESHSSRIDSLGEAFLSSVPGFLNTTIGASNINSLAASYSACQAPITFTNGLRAPTQPSASNGALRVSYGYTVSDGVNYTVSGNLTISLSSAFATTADQLGNPYQTITGVTGTRLYTYLPSGQSLLSTVTGLSTGAYAFADQRFYPYALLSSAPGVYTVNTAPFFDYDGLEFNINPSAPVNGAPIGNAAYPQYNSTSVYFTTPVTSAYLTEGYYLSPPDVSFQQQSYALLA